MSVVLTERDLSDPLNREQMRWEYERAQGDISLAAWARKWGAAQKGLGLCDKHYQRFKKYGDPSVVKINQHG